MKFKQRNGTNQTTQKTWQNIHTFHRQPLSTSTLTNGFPAIITQNISHRRLHKHSAAMAFNYTCHVVGDFWRPAHWVVGAVPVVVDQEGMQNKWHILWKDACKKRNIGICQQRGQLPAMVHWFLLRWSQQQWWIYTRWPLSDHNWILPEECDVYDTPLACQRSQ